MNKAQLSWALLSLFERYFIIVPEKYTEGTRTECFLPLLTHAKLLSWERCCIIPRPVSNVRDICPWIPPHAGRLVLTI